jgi:CTP synthase (UTP-ammonia lyase)
MTRVRIGIIGDFRPANPSHLATNEAIRHAASAAGAEAVIYWTPTSSLAGEGAAAQLALHDAIVASPGSPYASFEGALAGIRYARANGKPFLGTCGGFQHALIEYARNALGMTAADSQEHNTGSSELVIHQIRTPAHRGPRELPGGNTMRLAPGSLLRGIYGQDEIVEEFRCNFGVNPAYHESLAAGGLRPAALSRDGSWRAVELAGHPFYVATLFLPQHRSRPGAPHPVFGAWLRAAAGAASEVFAVR